MRKISRIYETLKIKARSKYILKTSNIRRKKLKGTNFTIISNNCWAGLVYQSYGLSYNTPTVGMFIVSDDYIKFVSNLKYYMSIDSFEVVEPEHSKWYNELKGISKYGLYPIARLGDIELHLLHYGSVLEAQEKWNRRKERIDYNHMLVKFSEMNLCNENNIQSFQNLEFENKICFISKKYERLQNDYTYVVSNDMKNQIKSTNEPIGKSHVVDINQVINSLF